MQRVVALVVVVVTFALAGAACSDDGDGRDAGARSSNAPAVPLVGTNWVLTTATEPRRAPEGVTVSAVFDTRTVSGQSGCNTYRAPYERAASSLTIGPDIATTLIECDGPQATVERAYLERLPQVQSYVINGERLSLLDRDGNTLLVYRASGADDLVGTWMVTSYYSGDALRSPIVGTELTAQFETRRVSGNAGCNQFGGDVETDGEEIAISSLIRTQRACADAAEQQQEDDYLAALELASTFRVTGDRLDLHRPDGGFAVTFTRAP